MLIVILGIIIGTLNLFDFGVAGLGEILLTFFMFYNGIVKKNKNVKFFKIYLFIIIFIIYIFIYIIITSVEFNLVLKNLFKWIILFIQIISIYECLTKNETNTIKLLLSYLCISKYIEVMNVSDKYFIHYFVLIFAFVILLRYKNIKKYEYLLYSICIFYIIFGDSRISLVLFISMFGFKILYNILKDFHTQNLSKKIKNILLIICIIIFGMVAFKYVYENISQETESNNERTLLIEITIEEIKNNPIFGVGPGNFNNYAQKCLGYNLRTSDLSPHNIYLEILAEYGIVGFYIFIMILWNIIKKLFDRRINLYTDFLIIYVLIYYLFSTFSGMNRIIFAVFIACILYYLNKDISKIKRSINEYN